MELNHLKYFYEVARHGSFTRASKALRVSQPSISKIVKQLEDVQGVRLFDRGKKAVELTETGRLFFASCELVFNELKNLDRNLENLKSADCGGELSLAASDNLCNHLLPQLLIGFRDSYPKVRVSLFSGVSEAIKAEIAASRAELGLFYTPVRDRAFEVARIAFVPFAVVCAPRLIRGGKYNLKFVETLGYLGSRQADYMGPYPVIRMLSSIGIRPNVAFETNSQETQKQMAVAGYGYSVLPRFMVRQELKSGALKALETPKAIGSDLYLVRQRNRTLSKAASVLEKFLEDKISSLLTN